MSDFISGIKHITPAYPVRPVQPVQPAQKDREPGERKKQDHGKADTTEHDGDSKTSIDEHV